MELECEVGYRRSSDLTMTEVKVGVVTLMNE
jgi:hypothetical protein